MDSLKEDATLNHVYIGMFVVCLVILVLITVVGWQGINSNGTTISNVGNY